MKKVLVLCFCMMLLLCGCSSNSTIQTIKPENGQTYFNIDGHSLMEMLNSSLQENGFATMSEEENGEYDLYFCTSDTTSQEIGINTNETGEIVEIVCSFFMYDSDSESLAGFVYGWMIGLFASSTDQGNEIGESLNIANSFNRELQIEEYTLDDVHFQYISSAVSGIAGLTALGKLTITPN